MLNLLSLWAHVTVIILTESKKNDALALGAHNVLYLPLMKMS